MSYNLQINQRKPIKVKQLAFSHTRSGFPLFYACEIFLSHIPVPALWKDKASRTSIRDVIVMLKRRHHVTSQRIRDSLEVFLMFFLIENEVFSGEQEKKSIIHVRVG